MHQYFVPIGQNIFLDKSVSFSYHIKEKMSKAMKGIGIIKKRVKHFPSILLYQYISHL